MGSGVERAADPSADLAADPSADPSAERCAGALLSVVPMLTRIIQQASGDAADIPLTLPQFRALGAIADRQEGSLADLAQMLGVTPPSLSVMIMRLETAGLVKKTRIKRQVRLELTPQGQDSYGRCIAALVNDLAGRVAGMSPDERRAVLSTTQALHRVISQTAQEPGEG